MKKTALLVLIAIGTLSCQEKIHTPDAEVRFIQKQPYIYHEGVLFSGSLYSTNENSKLEIENGSIKGCLIKHPNGKKAFIKHDITDKDSVTYFDETGIEQGKSEFLNAYSKQFIENLKALPANLGLKKYAIDFEKLRKQREYQHEQQNNKVNSSFYSF